MERRRAGVPTTARSEPGHLRWIVGRAQSVRERHTERIGAAWKLLPGQTYNSEYPGQFLKSIAETFPADQWKITLHETPEDQDKVVDVSLHFDPIR